MKFIYKKTIVGAFFLACTSVFSCSYAATAAPLDAQKDLFLDPDFIAFATELGLPVTEPGLLDMYESGKAQQQPDTQPILLGDAVFDGWTIHVNDNIQVIQPVLCRQKTGNCCAYNALFNASLLDQMWHRRVFEKEPFFDKKRIRSLFGMKTKKVIDPITGVTTETIVDGKWRKFIKQRDPNAGSGENVETGYLEELIGKAVPALQNRYSIIDGAGYLVSQADMGVDFDQFWNQKRAWLQAHRGVPYTFFVNTASQYSAVSPKEAAHWVAVTVVEDQETHKRTYVILNSFTNYILEKPYIINLIKSIEAGNNQFQPIPVDFGNLVDLLGNPVDQSKIPSVASQQPEVKVLAQYPDFSLGQSSKITEPAEQKSKIAVSQAPANNSYVSMLSSGVASAFSGARDYVKRSLNQPTDADGATKSTSEGQSTSGLDVPPITPIDDAAKKDVAVPKGRVLDRVYQFSASLQQQLPSLSNVTKKFSTAFSPAALPKAPSVQGATQQQEKPNVALEGKQSDLGRPATTEVVSLPDMYVQENLTDKRALDVVSIIRLAREVGLDYHELLMQLEEDQLDKDQLAVLKVLCTQGEKRMALHRLLSDAQKELVDTVSLFLE